MYTVPYDGYVMCQVRDANSTIDLWIEASLLRITLTYAATSRYALFVRKGMHVWVNGSGSNWSAFFAQYKIF